MILAIRPQPPVNIYSSGKSSGKSSNVVCSIVIFTRNIFIAYPLFHKILTLPVNKDKVAFISLG